MFQTLIAYAQRRLTAHRRYRQAIAEIRGMSNDELHEIGAFQIDLYEIAKRQLREG